ncbi:rRNA maturation factor [Bacillus coahuilensis p1.1.43]|uniref:Endoribonuclease YbeY n=1 Tax=Bacillus coahuilensis p1.1.43 TaxID=1150625 RepID=A0A147K7H4_9BACI|nr:rRNA maturation RNase YbeY [Bacillus coahuilensis]KUP06023.1 rRNA maturation factor [Bacillus coahuilensis p1.1.43]
MTYLEMDLLDETKEVIQDDLELVQGILHFAAKKEGVTQGSEVSLTFVTNERIQEVNREYRDKDQPTDVISFALEEMDENEIRIIGEGIPRVLGDIIISVERTREQASEYGHSFQRELGFLALHGFLHLLGYDHMNEQDEKVMFQRQKDILDEFGLKRS